MLLALLSIPCRGIGTETCGIGSVFPPDNHWIGLDTYINYILIYDLLLKVWWGVPLVLTDGERDSLWWPVSGRWLPCTGWCQYLLNMKCVMYGLLILQLSTSLRCFGLSFWKTGWTIFRGPPLYHNYILYSGWSTRVFQTWQPILLAVFWAVDEPISSCMMVQFYVYVSKWKSVCTLDIAERNSLLMFSFYHYLYTLPNCYLYYSSHMVSLLNSFLFEVLSIIIFHKCSLYSFLYVIAH